MAVIKMKPTSPGHRGMVKISRDHLHKGEGTRPCWSPSSRSPAATTTATSHTRHKGGGHKHHYRVVDFVRDKDGIAAKVERIEYDPEPHGPHRPGGYADGERRYIIAPRGLEVGASLLSGARPRFVPATPCRCATSRSARRSTASN